MHIPNTTPLQYLIMTLLLDGEKSGASMRKKLAERGTQKSGPAFYQLMSRMEGAGLIEGRYEQKVIDGQPTKERRYKITGDGVRTWERTRDFYLQQFRTGDQKGMANA